jgi:outer membrane lipoprotein-sorting protein
MSFLRTISTRRLLAGILGVAVAGVATTAIALAAVGGGPVPAPATLADAIHGALQGGSITGVSADVTFTNNLFSGASIDSSDPLLTGASGRLWATSGHLRIELQTDNGDGQIVVNGSSFWVYDPSSDTVYEGTLPSHSGQELSSTPSTNTYTVPSVAAIQSHLDKLSTHADVSGATPTDIGGQPAYTVSLTPNTSAGLLGEVRLGFDANHAIPLDFAVYPRGDSTPALELAASSVSYGAVPSSDFEISPPAGATVVHVSLPTKSNPTAPSASAQAGEPQFVGSGLGAVIVVKHASDSGAHSGGGAAGSGAAGPLPLQSVKVDGATGKQISTSLGTVLAFTRGGVDYLLAGSVTPATIDSVANGL